jgi:beta-glucanase (GH16 family)
MHIITRSCLLAGIACLLLLPAALPAQDALDGWKLLWADEFDGGALDAARWNFSQGGGGWGNGELQRYTKDETNVSVKDGVLHITARRGEDGSYTSGRINTRAKFAFTYGKVEARMLIPATMGLWPAFWMLGDTTGKTWPSCGEIDIMENAGKEPTLLHATVHGPGYSAGKGPTKSFDTGAALGAAWHTVGIEWEASEIRWYLDGALYHRLGPAELPAGKKWVFDHDFYLLLNLAVGGGFADYPTSASVFPQDFQIDWIRVYQRQ